MNHELLIMRHAKSDWSQNCGDFDRPLNKRGIRSAKKMGLWMKGKAILPRQILVSPARRALSTAQLFCNAASIDPAAIQIMQTIYGASESELYQVLRQMPDKLENILIIGHNPGLEALLVSLATEDIHLAREEKLLPTASIAHLTIQTPWRDLSEKQGLLRSITRPRTLFK